MAHFERDGIAFQYPETWTLTPETYDSGWAVALFSPGTAFLSLSLDTSGSPPSLLVDATLAALRDEYPQLDDDPVTDSLANLPALGHDVQFIALDLTNTCWVRAIAVSGGTLLVYWQVSDLEEQNQQVLRAICASLTVQDE